MANCAKCGKETKDGQIYCEECLSDMENDTFGDLFDSLSQQPEDENSSEDDFTKILEDLQGPREEIDDKKTMKESGSPSTVSDVFADAVSAISSLEDELELGEEENFAIEEGTQKKQSFWSRIFHRKKKNENSEESSETEQPDKKALKKARKEELKQKKAEEKSKKAEEKQKKQEELKKAKEEKAKQAGNVKKKSATDDDAESTDKKAKKSKKKDTKKADEKKAKEKEEKTKKAAKKKKEKTEKEKEIVVEEDLGHFNKPLLILVFSIFIAFGGYIIVNTFQLTYNKSIAVASRKFDNNKYNQAYEEIYGLKIKKSDMELYDKIMTVMYVNKQLNSYNNFMELNMYPEALDSLIKGLKRYDKYIDEAKILGITEDLDYVRDQILAELKKEFALGKKEAIDISKMKDQTEYSIKIYDVIMENTDYSK